MKKATKEAFRAEHVMKLQGKEYLPVAPRVVMFRQDHPDWSIVTQTVQVGDDHYVIAEISRPEDGGYSRVIATAHKRVRTNAKGPAALWPLETAETGAIGRALALCGYGTLAGDLDEGEELADSPQPAVGAAEEPGEPEDVGDAADTWVKKLGRIRSAKTLDKALAEAREYLAGLEQGSPEYAVIVAAANEAKRRVGGA